MRNKNKIFTDGWSNPDAKIEYESHTDEDRQELKAQNGVLKECSGCAGYHKLNYDWGLCCNEHSTHHLETIFEHFICGWFNTEGLPEEIAITERDTLVAQMLAHGGFDKEEDGGKNPLDDLFA